MKEKKFYAHIQYIHGLLEEYCYLGRLSQAFQKGSSFMCNRGFLYTVRKRYKMRRQIINRAKKIEKAMRIPQISFEVNGKTYKVAKEILSGFWGGFEYTIKCRSSVGKFTLGYCNSERFLWGVSHTYRNRVLNNEEGLNG